MAEREVSLQDLSLEQLNSLKTQLETELRQLTTSYGGLREAQARFNESNKALEDLTPENEGKEILLPLTSSMYIPGKLQHTDQVLVDVGTGYYVEKTVKNAKEFMDRKSDFLQANLDSLQGVMDSKRNNLEMVINFLQQKLRATSSAPAASSQK